MAKRSKPSSSSDPDEDVLTKKKSRTTKQVNNGGSSTTTTREAITPAASAFTTNSIVHLKGPQTTISASSPERVHGDKGTTGNSFLQSLRLTKSQFPDAPGNVKTTSQKADVAFASKSNNIDTSKNKLPLQLLITDASRRRSGTFLAIFLLASNILSAAYIVSQHTFHNLAQMRCVSTINKLQLELSNTKDEMKLLRKAMETLEGGYQDTNVGEKDVEGMITIVGSRTIKDHKQFLTSNEMDRWQQSLNTLEEEKLMMMNDFNEKLKSLL